jgi:hypothetical protein
MCLILSIIVGAGKSMYNLMIICKAKKKKGG